MKPYRYVSLSQAEDLLVRATYETSTKHHIRERCYSLLLSNQKHKIPAIAIMLNKHCDTIRRWFDQWQKDGLEGLKIKPGRGLKPILNVNNADVVDLIKKKVKEQPLKLNNILSAISEYVGLKVSKNVLKKFLKSLRYSYRRIRKVLKKSPDPAVLDAKLKEMIQLVSLEKQGFLKIYFADESGFNETPCVPYGWQSKDEPLSIPTTSGQRWNVFGIMSSDNQLFSKKTNGSVKSDFVIQAIDEFADSPLRAPRSVIIMDNATIHHAGPFKNKIPEWQEKGVEIFYLPTYSPHLNRIETLWRKCKYEWFIPDDFVSWKTVTAKLEDILDNFGTKYTIEFQPF